MFAPSFALLHPRVVSVVPRSPVGRIPALEPHTGEIPIAAPRLGGKGHV